MLFFKRNTGGAIDGNLLAASLLILSCHAQALFNFAGSGHNSIGGFSWVPTWGRGDESRNTTLKWSTPEECTRECKDGEAPLNCYYKFTLEYYTTMGAPCNWCTPSNINQLSTVDQCPCIIADGVEKTVFAINRMIPGPSIQVCKGDYIVVDMENNAEGLEATIHWHGVFQKGYQYYDGVPFLTQCPIHSSNTFRYQFAANNVGTHFYHSHISVHMIDGQYGSLIVREPPKDNPHLHRYDMDLPEHVILISDLFHELSLERFPGLYRADRGQTAQNILVNGKGNWTDKNTGVPTNAPLERFFVEPGKRYRFRLINAFGTVCLAQISIESHNLQIITMDGEPNQPVTVDAIVTGSGDRVDFILEANQTVKSYWIQVRGLGECEQNEVHQLAILQYNGGSDLPSSPMPQYYDGIPYTTILNPTNATRCPGLEPTPGEYCVNHLKNAEETDPAIMAVEPDIQILVPFNFYVYNNSFELLFHPGSRKQFTVVVDKEHLASLVGNVTYEEAPAPPLSQREGYERMCNRFREPTQCSEPCSCTHVYHVPLGATVEVIVYDKVPLDFLAHPFHLHGYAFTVFSEGQFGRNITDEDMARVINEHAERLRRGDYKDPPRKDTLIVPQGGYIIFRFIADNPGWWLFHCHFLWHTATGMNMVFHVGRKEDLPPVPNHFPKCYVWTPELQL